MAIEISIDDLVIAFRKAKVEVFYESGDPCLMDFVEYEKNLIENLTTFQAQLYDGKIDFITELDFDVPYHLTIKEFEFKEKQNNSFVYHSNGNRQWENSTGDYIDFRIIGALPVEFHILSSLWIDKVGEKFEAKLSENVYGGRLKRPKQKENYVNSSSENDSPKREYSSHFRPYIWDYKKWQENGVSIIKNSLLQKHDVIAITADLKKYYNNIDPSFIIDPSYWNDLHLYDLSDTEQHINELLYNALKMWSDVTYSLIEKQHDIYNGHIGIPIGLAASKIIANILLIQMDRDIENELLPIYYGRYVDDIFLVIRDNKKINDRDDLWDFIKKRINKFKNFSEEKSKIKPENNDIRYMNPYSRKSYILFSTTKEKLFVLEGSSGETFINAIEQSLIENSSEWRMLPNSEDDFENAAKQIINTSTDTTEIVNSIRKSDGISIQRLKFALFLRNTEELVSTLPKTAWTKSIHSFAELCKDFIFTPENIGTYTKYHNRIFRLIIFAGKEKIIKDIWATIQNTLSILRGKFSDDTHEITLFEKFEKNTLKQAIYTSINIHSLTEEKKKAWINIYRNLFPDDFLDFNKCIAAFICDVHFTPLKSIFFEPINVYKSYNIGNQASLHENPHNVFQKYFYESENIFDIESTILSEKEEACDWFWHKYYADKNNDGFPKSLALYTRRLSILEITQLITGWCSTNTGDFEKTLKAFDYPRLMPDVIESKKENENYYHISMVNEACKNPVFALASYEIKNASWKALVRKEREPDSTRIKRLFDLISDILKCNHNINFIVLPELSIPRKVLNLICKHLKTKNISLISGIEYHFRTSRDGKKTIVINQLAYILSLQFAGYRQQVQITQDKTLPAIHEQEDLFNASGIIYKPSNSIKYIINHNNFFISGLICNDLLNIDNRKELRGKIDALIVVEWNSDINTYNALVESSANDLHCFVVQVNNRAYGDTRLRAPYKADYKRDVARIKGGELDYFVVSSLEVNELKDFQKNYISPDEPFKPVPTGFEMSDERKKCTNS